MKRIILLFGFLLAYLLSGNVFAYNNHGYPYTVTSGCMATCYGDAYDFCKNNCTSYAAYMLNLYIGFNNNHRSSTDWSDGNNWDDRANSIGISVDN